MMINDEVPGWQPTGYWGKSYRISMLIKNKIKKAECSHSANRAGIFH